MKFACMRCIKPKSVDDPLVFNAEWQEIDSEDEESISSGYPYCPKCKSREYVDEEVC